MPIRWSTKPFERGIRMVCVGTSPLLMDKFEGTTFLAFNHEPLDWWREAQQYLFRDKDGRIALPVGWLRTLLCNIYWLRRFGDVPLQSMISFPSQPCLLLTDKTGKSPVRWRLNGRPGKVIPWAWQPRPRIDNWRFEVSLTYNPALMEAQTLTTLFRRAGEWGLVRNPHCIHYRDPHYVHSQRSRPSDGTFKVSQVFDHADSLSLAVHS